MLVSGMFGSGIEVLRLERINLPTESDMLVNRRWTERRIRLWPVSCVALAAIVIQ